MKQRIFLALLALALVPAAARAGSVGIGVFGGISVPILYDGATNGTQYGARLPIGLLPFLTLEPYYAQSELGDKDETFGGVTYTRSGPEVESFGANALFNFGGPVRFYPYAGIGQTTIKQTGSDDVTDTSINFGLGFGFTPVGSLSIDIRGELNSIVTGDTSRKFGNLTAGVSYAFSTR